MRLEHYHLQEFFIEAIHDLFNESLKKEEASSNLDTLIKFRDRIKQALDVFNTPPSRPY